MNTEFGHFFSFLKNWTKCREDSSSHLLMQKRTIEIKLVSFLVDQGLLIVFFVSEKVSRKFHETFLVHEKKKIKKEGYIYRNIGRIGSEEVGS